MGVARARTKTRASHGARKRPEKYPLDKAHGRELNWRRTQLMFEAGRYIENISFVYVIGEGEDGPVKIGKAVDPVKRLREMQGTARHPVGALTGARSTQHRGNRVVRGFDSRPSVSGSRDRQLSPPPHPDLVHQALDVPVAEEHGLETAAEDQLDFVYDTDEITHVELARIVLTAHRKHNPAIHQREEMRFLAQGAGYVIQRASMVQHLDRWLTKTGWRDK